MYNSMKMEPYVKRGAMDLISGLGERYSTYGSLARHGFLFAARTEAELEDLLAWHFDADNNFKSHLKEKITELERYDWLRVLDEQSLLSDGWDQSSTGMLPGEAFESDQMYFATKLNKGAALAIPGFARFMVEADPEFPFLRRVRQKGLNLDDEEIRKNEMRAWMTRKPKEAEVANILRILKNIGRFDIVNMYGNWKWPAVFDFGTIPVQEDGIFRVAMPENSSSFSSGSGSFDVAAQQPLHVFGEGLLSLNLQEDSLSDSGTDLSYIPECYEPTPPCGKPPVQ